MNHPIEELQDLNLQDIYMKLQLSDNDFDDWLIKMGLLHRSQTCDHYGNQMTSDGRNCTGYVTSAGVCMVTQCPRKYSISYGIFPPSPSTSENYKNLIKFICGEKSIGRVVQTVDDGRNFGEIGKVRSRISTFYVNPDDFWISTGRFIARMYLVEVLGFEALRDLETAES